MTTLDEILDALAALEGVDAKDFSRQLRSKAHALYQQVYNEGHSTATTASEEKLRKAEEARGAAEAAQKEAEQKAREQTKGSEDAEKVRAEKDAEIQKLQATHEERLSKLADRLDGERRARVKADLRATLTAQKVDPDYADFIVEKHLARVGFDEDGNARVLQAGLSIPYANVPEGKTHLDLLAEEIHKAVPKKFIGAAVQGGSGAPGSGEAPGTGSALEQARSAGEAAAKEQRAAADTAALAFN